MAEAIIVHEAGRELRYTYADLMHYHGFGFPGGVAHAFKVLQRALPLLSPGGPPERRDIAIRTPFGGPGARDAFEMVTRGLTEGRYTVDPSLAAVERGETLKGYVFILSFGGRTVRLMIREGIVRDEFIALGRKQGRTPDEDARLEYLKHEMADRLLALAPEDVYDAVLEPAA
ncbi:MAG TPA: hypothetical protein PK286_01035 [Devosia sp.]|nr:hypothetical protein [Devosia sp.]